VDWTYFKGEGVGGKLLPDAEGMDAPVQIPAAMTVGLPDQSEL